MSQSSRKWLLGSLAVLTAVVGSWLALPAHANETSTTPDTGPIYDAIADELKLANADVDPNATLEFGAEPLQYVTAAAETAANNAACSISTNEAVALSIAMTWPEVSPSGAPPSPMTLSRYDTQPALGDPAGRAAGLWFHPGIGMWQLDSAGLGTTYSAYTAIDAKTSADGMVPFIVNKYCNAINAGNSAASARATAWTDWNACRNGACEDVYHRALSGVSTVDGVGRYGGAEARRCFFHGKGNACLFVDPSKAQGADWWAQPGGGRSPIASPFYVMTLTDDAGNETEIRYWFSQHSGASSNVQVLRPYGANARTGLEWATGQPMCDLTTWTGDC